MFWYKQQMQRVPKWSRNNLSDIFFSLLIFNAYIAIFFLNACEFSRAAVRYVKVVTGINMQLSMYTFRLQDLYKIFSNFTSALHI